jgi:GntR family transcriptional repressor for pyruvate dehydrogenase complex
LTLAPIERQRLYRQVAEEIKRYILDHSLKKGDALPTEVEFAQQLGVSRPTVREALKGLQMVGVLTSRKGSGHAVGALNLLELARQFSFHVRTEGMDFQELAETRLFLEMNILPLVAERATEEDFRRLQQAVNLLKQGADRQDRAMYVAGDIDFHQALFEASQNRLLTGFAGVIKEFFVDVRCVLFASEETSTERVNRDHQAICDALRRKDVCRAQALMYTHLSVYLSDGGSPGGIQTFIGPNGQTGTPTQDLKRSTRPSNAQLRKEVGRRTQSVEGR